LLGLSLAGAGGSINALCADVRRAGIGPGGRPGGAPAMPALIVVGVAGQAALWHWHCKARAVASARLLLNSALLTVLAVRGLVVDL